MKPTVFPALALAALLLGSWQAPPQWQRATQTPRPLVGPARPEPPALPAVQPDTRTVRATAPAPKESPAAVRLKAGPMAGPGPAEPAFLAPSGVPGPGTPAQGDTASAAPDWRDGALDLLSQIGLLCPAAGCDSLEDD